MQGVLLQNNSAYADLSKYKMSNFTMSRSNFINFANELATLYANNPFTIVHWYNSNWLINTIGTSDSHSSDIVILSELPTTMLNPRFNSIMSLFVTNGELSGQYRYLRNSYIETIPVTLDSLTFENGKYIYDYTSVELTAGTDLMVDSNIIIDDVIIHDDVIIKFVFNTLPTEDFQITAQRPFYMKNSPIITFSD